MESLKADCIRFPCLTVNFLFLEWRMDTGLKLRTAMRFS